MARHLNRLPALLLALGALPVWAGPRDAPVYPRPYAPFSRKYEIPKEARVILAGAERFELFSLDPSLEGPGGKRPTKPTGKRFHRVKVLGQTSVRDPATRKRLVSALREAVRPPTDAVPACFEPRHGLRATRQGKTADLVICFECTQAEVHLPDGKQEAFLLSDAPARLFNQVLRRARVPLAEPRRR